MVRVKEDLSGKTFGRWKVLYQTDDYVGPGGKHEAMWHCVCSCESHTESDVLGSNLRHGRTLSCGCLVKEKIKELQECNKKHNKYDLSGDCGVGLTSNTNREFYFDLEDFDLIYDYCWFEDINKEGYHCLKSNDNQTRKMIRFHQLLGYKNYDHINRNPLDNRKSNLRPATNSQNSMNRSKRADNTSGVIGVSWYKKLNKWVVKIYENKKQHHLGYFIDKEEAIKVRLRAEVKYFGEFAPQKHLFEEYGII